MLNNLKKIKKPSFVITYFIQSLITLAVVCIIGILSYQMLKSWYEDDILFYKTRYEDEIRNSINNTVFKDKVTGKDCSELKIAVVEHYSYTNERYEIKYDGQEIVDSSETAYIFCNLNSKSYNLLLADNKFLECFKTPDVLKYQTEPGWGDDGLYHGSSIMFSCKEFYVNLNNMTFIPAVVEIFNPKADFMPTGLIVNFEPDNTDGYTLIKTEPDNNVLGYVKGHTGKELLDEYTGSLVDYSENGVRVDIKSTGIYTRDFYDKYSSIIILVKCSLVFFAFAVALIAASIRYNINKRNYEIYEYRRQTTNAMAHDLKTPIASIIAYSELLQNNVDAGNRELYLAKISETAAQMNNSVNNILQFSRSENAAVPVSKSEVKIAEIVNCIISDNEQKIGEKGLKVDFDEKTAPTLNTDKELFRQALGNLINNAVLYSKDNTSVTIECNDDRIIIKNVMAEPVEDINKIKEPFIKGSSSREKGGTGLGLAIAENDLAMLKYTLNVKTENELFVCTVDFK